MSRKHILIVNNNMYIGGVQKALENLLWEIHSDYDVTLLLFYKGGELLNKIPHDIDIIEAVTPFRYLGMSKYDAHGIKNKLLRLFFAVFTRVFGMKKTIRFMGLTQKKMHGYDTAISFLHSGREKVFYGGCNEFVLDFVEAEQKIAFVHCDFEKIGASSEKNRKIYNRFDRIATCSDGCRTSFLKCFPELSQKTYVVRNCQNYNEIKRMAQVSSEKVEGNGFNVLTVARFGKEKGIPRAVRAFAGICNAEKTIRYYIIGDGAERRDVELLISNTVPVGSVTLLGEKENPYGYMAKADILLIPSISEAAPMVINESACLGTPVLSTDTSSAVEMICETGFGWVCENSEDGIRKEILRLAGSRNEVKCKREFLRTQRFDNVVAIKQFSELISQDDKTTD